MSDAEFEALKKAADDQNESISVLVRSFLFSRVKPNRIKL